MPFRFACVNSYQQFSSNGCPGNEVSPLRFGNPAQLVRGTETVQNNPMQQQSPAKISISSPNAASPVNDQQLYNSVQICRCQRPQSLIMCSSCGFAFTGRVRRRCPVHPSEIYLMDQTSCPSCNSNYLKEYAKK